MRIRTIKPEFYKHDGIAALPPLTRLLFTGLWCMADSEGRMEDRPKRIKAEVVPYDECNVEEMLSELAANGFIVRYECNGAHFIEIPAFQRHQRLSGKETLAKSRYPAPTGSKREATRKRRGSNGEAPVKHPESLERKGKEGKGKDGSNECFPGVLDCDEFRKAWDDYLTYRRQRKLSTLTAQSIRARLAELERWGLADAVTAIQHTIANGWQGIFPPKNHGDPSKVPIRGAPEMSAERAAELQRLQQAELDEVHQAYTS